MAGTEGQRATEQAPPESPRLPDYIVPMHCTGEPFYEMVKAEMPEKLLRSFTGTRFVFDAEGHT